MDLVLGLQTQCMCLLAHWDVQGKEGLACKGPAENDLAQFVFILTQKLDHILQGCSQADENSPGRARDWTVNGQ
jgi:Rieske Fe-S protein